MPYLDYRSNFSKSIGIDNGGPYAIWKAPNRNFNPNSQWWTVLDRLGTNVIHGSHGAKFTSKKKASTLAWLWNKQ